MKIKATIDGEELEFTVLGSKLGHEATHILTNVKVSPWEGDHLDGSGLLLRLIRKQHIFGLEDGPKVVFEETGEVREPLVGEWALAGSRPFFTVEGHVQRHTILRPVALED